MQAEARTGPILTADGALNTLRSDRTGAAIVSDGHARYLEANYRGTIFSGGMGLTSINNSTYTTGTLTASCTPVIGLWNPSTNTANLVILQATLGVTATALQATGCGPFVWASSVGNTAVSTGNSPLNRKTLIASGSLAKDMTNVALTGLTNALTVKFGSSMGGGSAVQAAFLATQVALQTVQTSFVENFDGSLIVPPGGLLALLASGTPVAHSAASSITWEEVPI